MRAICSSARNNSVAISGGKSERRFVEKEQRCTAQKRATDRYHVLLAAAHRAHRLAPALGRPRKKQFEHVGQIGRSGFARMIGNAPNTKFSMTNMGPRQISILGDRGDTMLDDPMRAQSDAVSRRGRYNAPYPVWFGQVECAWGRRNENREILLRLHTFNAGDASGAGVVRAATPGRSPQRTAFVASLRQIYGYTA